MKELRPQSGIPKTTSILSTKHAQSRQIEMPNCRTEKSESIMQDVQS